MSLFTEWNSLLLSEYFTPAHESEEVWIQTTRPELDSFGLHLGGTAGLIEAVLEGPEWDPQGKGSPAEVALRLVNQRRANLRTAKYVDPGKVSEIYLNQKAPTYLPILALWVLASSETLEGFYAHVQSILDRPFPNTPHVTSAMESSWKDLETWSTVETSGKLGRFRLRVLGKNRFVGIPRSQCMFSHKDVGGLRQLFTSCHLRPNQHLTDSLFLRIVELGIDSHYLSNSLKHAMRHHEYHDPLKTILEDNLRTWDGRSRKLESNLPTVKRIDQFGIDSTPEATLKLAPLQDGTDGWEIRWRFPASGQSNECCLLIENVKLPSALEPSSECFSTSGMQHQDICRNALSRSASDEVRILVEYNDEDAYEVGGGIRTNKILKRNLRILVWDSPDPRLGEELVERNLPISGPVYLVTSSNTREKTSRYLSKEGIANEPLSSIGLPSGWTLVCIPKSERLLSHQRSWLTDGNDYLEPEARIRLVGGRPIIRGGMRLYAYYDLPFLELEAPETSIPIANGMNFEQIHSNLGVNAKTKIRRFTINVIDKGKAVFDIVAMCEKRQLASTKIRLSVPQGTGSNDGRLFGLDYFGRSTLTESGLRGASIHLPNNAIEETLADGSINVKSIGVLSELATLPQESISAKFLDTLAVLGSVSYGAARDQLNRLAEKDRISIQPALLLLELKSRGHIEIQTDRKGHLIRIHRVTPTIYSLPIMFDGLQLYGVCGSLRLQDWQNLIEHSDFIVFIESHQVWQLPTVRLAILDRDTVICGVADLGFSFEAMPSISISSWAGSIAQATSELSSWGWGNLAADIEQLQRLHAGSGKFISSSGRDMVVDPGTRRQLFRLDDPSVQGLQVYVLGSIQSNGATTFSFIHDSRWGVWITVTAFAAMLKARHLSLFDYASPWPIHYDQESRCLWLPARLRPPSVIERSLIMCSGGAPLEFQVVEPRHSGSVELRDKMTGEILGNVSPVYLEFAEGYWLCYRWIPPTIASRVANLLGGDIQGFMNFGRCLRYPIN